MKAAQFPIAPWQGQELAQNCGRMPVPAEVCDELVGAIDYLRANPLPLLSLRLADFELPATQLFGREVRAAVDSGPGFALLQRLPVEAWSLDECRAAYWLLGQSVGRPVAQSHDGKMLYDVRDFGRPAGNGVRPDVTNIGQNFHTDNSYNTMPPDVVGLMCIHPAREGGVSGIVNFAWAHQELAQRAPELLSRLHEPFYFDRQREHADGDLMYTHHPMFEVLEAKLIARLSKRQVVNGYALAGAQMDRISSEALDAFEAVMNEAGAAHHFDFQPGEVQFVNNLALGHKRSAFVDFDEPQRKRHLLRLWLRERGRPGYSG